MLRITFTILAIVASTITLSINSIGSNEWWQYTPMATLILISLILWIAVPTSKRNRKPKNSDSELQALNEEESLADLGILDIRPVDSDKSSTDLEESSSSQKTQDATTDTDVPRVVQLSLLTETPQPNLRDAPLPYVPNNPLDKHILTPVLQGFRAVLDAHSVGVVRPISDDYEYEVCGTAGFDWIRARGESFVLKYDLLEESETAAIHSVGSKGLQSNHLTYSRKPASVTYIGITSIGQTDKLLLLDTINKNGLSHPRAKELLKNFGQTLALLLYRENPNRPRHEIIYEEMMTARTENKDLVFALVVPQRSETLVKMYGDFLDDIEKTFSDCLLRADPKSRVIKFGELLYGVFQNCQKDTLEVWNHTVQSEIANQGGLLTGGAFIGAVVMTNEHQTADHLRDDAKRALIKAYEGPAETVII